MIGDLVQIVTDDCDAGDARSCGTVLKFDTYSSNELAEVVSHQGRRSHECIVEVLWNTGSIGWILKSRIGRV